jgi:hypothetical protein
MLKASLLSLPPPEADRVPVALGVSAREPELAASSSEWEYAQPEDDPEKTTGWQSWPAAMS